MHLTDDAALLHVQPAVQSPAVVVARGALLMGAGVAAPALSPYPLRPLVDAGFTILFNVFHV